MGLAELILGKTNPFAQFVAENRNTIHGAAAGFGQGTNFGDGLGYAARGAAQGQVADDAYATSEKARMERERQLQTAIENIRTKYNNPALADWLASTGESGLDAAWGEVLKGMSPSAVKPIEINGQLVDPNTFQVLGDFRTQEAPKPPTPPSGYQYKPDGSLSFIPGGPADASAVVKPPTDADVRADKLAEVVRQDAILLLGDGTPQNPGVFDALGDPWDQTLGAGLAGFTPGRGLTGADFQQAQNALGNIAQSYLYAISGQAAPAGEVAKIVDSVTPKFGESKQAVDDKKTRLATYIRAISMSKRDTQNSAQPGGVVDYTTYFGAQ